MNEFNRLLEKEIPRLQRYAFALTRNMSRADDLVQDTLVRAIAKQHYWQEGTNLRAWLFTIMHNQNVNSSDAAHAKAPLSRSTMPGHSWQHRANPPRSCPYVISIVHWLGSPTSSVR